MEFIKECKDVVLKTKVDVKKEIEDLEPIKVDLSNGKYVIIDFAFVMSMIDGKILAFITNTKSIETCPICGATPKLMTDKYEFKKGFKVKPDALCYGICPLHVWMWFFECLLNASYRLE